MSTNPEEFKQFHNALTKGRPHYDPWYFLLNKSEKDPLDGQGWKASKHQLNYESAVRALEMGHNIGIAGTDEDGLVIIDVDDKVAFIDHTFIPTLTAISSSRIGMHHFYFTNDKNAKINIALEHAGEVRSNWQYVVAPGSYAKLTDSKDDQGNITKTTDDKYNTLPDDEKPYAGKYTLENIMAPALITYDEFPSIFKEELTKRNETEIIKKNKPPKDFVPSADSNKSALFELEIDDVISSIPDRGRHPSLFHDSHTGKNTSISDDLLHCWRHNVSHNAISALAVMAGLFDCVDAGTGHKHSGSGSSCIDYDDGETIYKIWTYAKENGYIPKNDPMPSKVITWFALKNGFCTESDLTDGHKVPMDVYLKVLKVIGLYVEKQKKDVAPAESDNHKTNCSNIESVLCNSKGDIIPKLLGDDMLSKDEYMTLRDNGELYIYRDGVFHIDIKAGDAKAIANDILEMKASVKNVNEGVSYVMHKTRIDRDNINCAPFKINMKNGMYDVLKDELLPHSPDYKSTIQIDTEYNPDAKCPAITKFLFELMDPIDVPLIIQFIGYCMVQDVAQQKALLIDGSARNGKSTLIKLITSMVGNAHISGESLEEISKDRFSTMQLSGKLANAHPDLSANAIVDTSIFKTVVTETRLTGQGKGKDKIMFDNICTHIFACNMLPDVDESETAYFRRFVQVTFPNTFEGDEDDKDILNKITTEDEKSGFFNCCMVGLRALLEYGEYCDLETTESNQKRYLDKSNPIGRFFDERTAPSVKDTPKTTVYYAYVGWCNEIGIKPKHDNVFWKEVNKQGLIVSGREGSGDRLHTCKGLCVSVLGAVHTSTPDILHGRGEKQEIEVLIYNIRPDVQAYREYNLYAHTHDIYTRIYAHKNTELKKPGRTDAIEKQEQEKQYENLYASDDQAKPEKHTFFSGCPSQRDTVNFIKATIQDLQIDGKTPITTVLDHAIENGIAFDRCKAAINRMKADGSIFEPTEGFYKCI